MVNFIIASTARLFNKEWIKRVIASEAWQSRKKDGMGCGVIASEAWQSHKKE